MTGSSTGALVLIAVQTDYTSGAWPTFWLEDRCLRPVLFLPDLSPADLPIDHHHVRIGILSPVQGPSSLLHIQNALAMDRFTWLLPLVVIEYMDTIVYVDYPQH